MNAAERIAERVYRWKSPGVGGVALVVTCLIMLVTDSLWPMAVWLVTALGASFDRGWERGTRDESRATGGGLVRRSARDAISEGIKRSRGALDSLQALKDARFAIEALHDAGWKIVRWDTGEEAEPLGPPHDEWEATPGLTH